MNLIKINSRIKRKGMCRFFLHGYLRRKLVRAMMLITRCQASDCDMSYEKMVRGSRYDSHDNDNILHRDDETVNNNWMAIFISF